MQKPKPNNQEPGLKIIISPTPRHTHFNENLAQVMGARLAQGCGVELWFYTGSSPKRNARKQTAICLAQGITKANGWDLCPTIPKDAFPEPSALGSLASGGLSSNPPCGGSLACSFLLCRMGAQYHLSHTAIVKVKMTYFRCLV